MKTEYKYISFKLLGTKTKTSVWECKNNSGGYTLGIIKWYPSWRQYCYFPTIDAVYSKGCLEDINNFITQLMDNRK